MNILPEHNNYRGPRQEIDPQEWDGIMRVLVESFGMQTVAQFHLYDPYEDCAAIGVVERIYPYTRKLTIDGERFKMADIIGAEALASIFWSCSP